MKRILITKYNNQILTALLENGIFYEIILSNPNTSIIGNIYVGRIERKLKNIHSFFVSYGLNKTAYLSEEDCKQPIVLMSPSHKNSLVEGSLVLVQITKEGIKTKDPTVTTNISLQGKYCVIVNNEKKLRFSSKLTKRKRIELQQELNLSSTKDFGILIRTSAIRLDKSSYYLISDEIEFLSEKMHTILNTSKALKAHTMVYKEKDSHLLKIRDLDLNEFEKIITDDLLIYNQLSDYLDIYFKKNIHKIALYNDPDYTLYKLYQIEKEIHALQNKIVYLKNGSSLYIEQTEAMHIIDVNTGNATKGKEREETFYQTNILAAKEIGRQIRLRNLSGIIIIDFINMKDRNNTENLISFLINIINKDPIKTQFIDITKLGLIELTRKRTLPTLKEQIFDTY